MRIRYRLEKSKVLTGCKCAWDKAIPYIATGNQGSRYGACTQPYTASRFIQAWICKPRLVTGDRTRPTLPPFVAPWAITTKDLGAGCEDGIYRSPHRSHTPPRNAKAGEKGGKTRCADAVTLDSICTRSYSSTRVPPTVVYGGINVRAVCSQSATSSKRSKEDPAMLFVALCSAYLSRDDALCFLCSNHASVWEAGGGDTNRTGRHLEQLCTVGMWAD